MRKRPFVQVLHTRQCGENEIEQLLSCLLMPPLNPMRLLNKLCKAGCLGLILRAEFFFHEYGRHVGMVPRSSLKEGKYSQVFSYCEQKRGIQQSSSVLPFHLKKLVSSSHKTHPKFAYKTAKPELQPGSKGLQPKSDGLQPSIQRYLGACQNLSSNHPKKTLRSPLRLLALPT